LPYYKFIAGKELVIRRFVDIRASNHKRMAKETGSTHRLHWDVRQVSSHTAVKTVEAAAGIL
jgi:hypothetical protein